MLERGLLGKAIATKAEVVGPQTAPLGQLVTSTTRLVQIGDSINPSKHRDDNNLTRRSPHGFTVSNSLKLLTSQGKGSKLGRKLPMMEEQQKEGRNGRGQDRNLENRESAAPTRGCPIGRKRRTSGSTCLGNPRDKIKAMILSNRREKERAAEHQATLVCP
ncbi:unnamed protein product [Linum trigynum]